MSTPRLANLDQALIHRFITMPTPCSVISW